MELGRPQQSRGSEVGPGEKGVDIPGGGMTCVASSWGAPAGHLGASWLLLGRMGGRLGAPWRRPVRIMGRLGGFFGASESRDEARWIRRAESSTGVADWSPGEKQAEVPFGGQEPNPRQWSLI